MKTERIGKRDGERGADRKLSPSGPVVSLPEDTQAHSHKHIHQGTNTQRQTALFSCFVLFSFNSYKQYLMNEHPDSISEHLDFHSGTHVHRKHMLKCETDTLANRQP